MNRKTAALRAAIKTTALSMMIIATLGSCKKGDTGAAGVDGNANVNSVTWTINTTDWQWDGTSKLNYVTIPDPEITSDIVSTGTVSVFITANPANTNWNALPLTLWSNPSYNYGFVYSYNQLQITFSNTNLASATPNATIYAKIVAISASNLRKHPNTDWHNYEQVKATLGNELVETTLIPATLKH